MVDGAIAVVDSEFWWERFFFDRDKSASDADIFGRNHDVFASIYIFNPSFLSIPVFDLVDEILSVEIHVHVKLGGVAYLVDCFSSFPIYNR